MYDFEFYADTDQKMMHVLKHVTRTNFMGMKILVNYLLLQLYRLYEYIADRIKTEEQSQSEMMIRFKRLERNGHI